VHVNNGIGEHYSGDDAQPDLLPIEPTAKSLPSPQEADHRPYGQPPFAQRIAAAKAFVWIMINNWRLVHEDFTSSQRIATPAASNVIGAAHTSSVTGPEKRNM